MTAVHGGKSVKTEEPAGGQPGSRVRVISHLSREMPDSRPPGNTLAEAETSRQRSLREIPSLRIMAFRVVRGRPRRAAAALTTPPFCRRMRRMCSRST